MTIESEERTTTVHRVRVFDPTEVFETHVDGRRVVYLDTNFWIRLTDQETEDAKECLRACQTARLRGTVLFPLSWASVSELLEQPPESPRMAQAALMDDLSGGVTFRIADRIYDVESRAALNYYLTGSKTPVDRREDRRELFTLVPDYLGDGYLDFPPRVDGAEGDWVRSGPSSGLREDGALGVRGSSSARWGACLVGSMPFLAQGGAPCTGAPSPAAGVQRVQGAQGGLPVAPVHPGLFGPGGGALGLGSRWGTAGQHTP